MNVWDLTPLFKNEKELETSALSLQNECEKFEAKYSDKFLNLNDEEFLAALNECENLLENIARVQIYVSLVFSKDTSKGAFYAKFDELSSKAQNHLLFFELKFNEFDEARQNKIIAKSARLGYYLDSIAKEKAHQLSLKEEQILLRTANTGAEGFSRLFDETLSKLKFKFKGEMLGEEEILSKLHSPDRAERKAAAKSLSGGLAPQQHLLSYIYNMIKTSLKTSCELRKFDLPESPRHFANQTTKASVDALIKAAETSFDLPIKFYEKKRKILGFKKLYDYDRYAPLGESKSVYKFEECKKIVLETFSKFSPKFGDIAARAFKEGWIDVYPAENKRGGAFSQSGVAKAHPYVLLNHTDERRDLFTLAHELGHAAHQNLAYESVGFLNADTPLTTAETASVFCEMLVFDHVKSTLKGREKTALLAGKIEDIFATLYRQINFTTFERRVHAHEGEIGAEELNKIWLEESAKMFGRSVTLNDYYKIWWSYIPHFIHTPFYCYAYSYAQLLVLAIFGLYKSGKCENFVQIYTEFLSAGGSRSPKELVGMFGFDIEDAAFWQIRINEVRKLVEEFCQEA